MGTCDIYSINARKQRWNDFLDINSGMKHVYTIQIYSEDQQSSRPNPWPELKNERIEWAWKKYNIMLENSRWLSDDSVPFLDIYSGTEIFAEAFGCNIHRPADNMPFAKPLVQNAAQASRLKTPELSSTPLTILFDIADELRRRAGPGTLVRLPDIQSPMDIAALIWDKNDFYIALLEEKEAVLELVHKIYELLTAFLDEWFSRYGREFMAHHPDYYMSSGITLSEDEIGVVNSDMFATLFLPELTELSERYGQIGIHCCANADHQWEQLKKVPNLRLLNLYRDVETLKSAYEFFADHTAQLHNWFGDGAPWTYPMQHPRAHVAFCIGVGSKREAAETAEKMWTACGR